MTVSDKKFAFFHWPRDMEWYEQLIWKQSSTKSGIFTPWWFNLYILQLLSKFLYKEHSCKVIFFLTTTKRDCLIIILKCRSNLPPWVLFGSHPLLRELHPVSNLPLHHSQPCKFEKLMLRLMSTKLKAVLPEDRTTTRFSHISQACQ